MPLPFDSTGVAPGNKIVNEQRTVIYSSGNEPYLIIPNFSPFYKDRFSVVDESGQTLVEGADYIFSHIWPDGKIVLNKDVFGSIALLNISTSGSFFLNYQSVGGNYPTGNAINTEGFHALTLGQLSILDWQNTPLSFPATVHTHPLVTGFEGMQQIFAQLDAIKEALLYPMASMKMDDVEDLGAVFVTPVLDKLNQIILNITKPTLDGNEVSDINLKLNSLVQAWTPIAVDLDYYEIPLAKHFKIKIGKMVCDPAIAQGDPGGYPLEIVFPAPAFPNQCLFAHVQVMIKDSVNSELHDVRWGNPLPDKIPYFYIDTPNNEYPTAPRLLTYIAIGI